LWCLAWSIFQCQHDITQFRFRFEDELEVLVPIRELDRVFRSRSGLGEPIEPPAALCGEQCVLCLLARCKGLASELSAQRVEHRAVLVIRSQEVEIERRMASDVSVRRGLLYDAKRRGRDCRESVVAEEGCEIDQRLVLELLVVLERVEDAECQ